jgi:hypothetical protein
MVYKTWSGLFGGEIRISYLGIANEIDIIYTIAILDIRRQKWIVQDVVQANLQKLGS